MTKQEKIDAIYKEIANKELSFGCRVFGYSVRDDTQKEHIMINNNAEYMTSEDLDGLETRDFKPYWMVDDYGEDDDGLCIIKTKGHPVMIGDVLDYIDKNAKLFARAKHISGMIDVDLKAREQYVIGLYNHYIGKHRLPIEEQSEECISYIFNLLNEGKQ